MNKENKHECKPKELEQYKRLEATGMDEYMVQYFECECGEFTSRRTLITNESTPSTTNDS